ncbi:unnamed protein product, partial [Candidula unifasciata]
MDSVSASLMQEKGQYHLFFSHCPQDRQWVEHLIAELQSPPYNYLCTVLRAAMLSQQVVLVLSRHYLQGTWASFEKTMRQLSQMSQYHHQVLAVLLEDCDIPESIGSFYCLEARAPDFFLAFTSRFQSTTSNGTILAVCRLHLCVGWNSFLTPVDGSCLDTSPSLSSHGIGMEKTELAEIVSQVSAVIDSSNKLPWILSAQPLAVLLLCLLLWLPACVAIIVVHLDELSGIALPVRLTVFLFPLGLVVGGYLIKWRRSYWMRKVVQLLVQNCVEVNQAFYFQGRPLFVTSAHLRANMFSIYFVYFDATDCV